MSIGPPLTDLPSDITDVRDAFAQRCLTIALASNTPDISRYFRGVNFNQSQPHKSDDVSPSKAVNPTIVVPGLSGDTVSALVAPFMCARDEMAVRDYEVEVVWLNGRTGCDANAATLRKKVLDAADKYSEKIHLVGYSKGCSDSMHMLANHPDTHNCVASLVSLGGIVFGSPLADTTPTWLRKVVQYTPFISESFGDGSAIRDLTYEYRKAWMNDNPLPTTVHYASIAGVPTPDRVSRVLRKSYQALNEHSTFNDSQVIDRDTLLPNSELLATVNADHWAIALPFSRRWTSALTHLFINHNDFPRAVLLQATIDHLSDYHRSSTTS